MFKQINITSLIIISSHLIVIINSQFKPQIYEISKSNANRSDAISAVMSSCSTDMDSAELVVANSTYEANTAAAKQSTDASQNLSTTR
jgi:hypothetical protein